MFSNIYGHLHASFTRLLVVIKCFNIKRPPCYWSCGESVFRDIHSALRRSSTIWCTTLWTTTVRIINYVIRCNSKIKSWAGDLIYEFMLLKQIMKTQQILVSEKFWLIQNVTEFVRSKYSVLTDRFRPCNCSFIDSRLRRNEHFNVISIVSRAQRTKCLCVTLSQLNQ